MTDTATASDVRLDPRLDSAWATIVWDDPVNLMTYVTFVFMEHFGFDRATAERRMLEVHTEGRSILATGPREQMELHVRAMHGYGLLATLERVGA